MSYKLKHESISRFSLEIASKICDQFYAQNSKMEGDSLMNLTESKQVNSFLIKGLFSQWKNEIEKLESPYFDYGKKEVQNALKSFMNTLSNHISVGRAHLEPLLIEALRESILLTFDPKQYIMESLPATEKANYLKAQLRYIKTHQEGFKALAEASKANDLNSDIERHFESVAGLFDVPEPVPFLKKLNAIDAMDTLFRKVEEPIVAKPVMPEAEPPKPLPEPATPQMEVSKEKPVQGTLNDRFNGKTSGLTLAEKLQKKVNKSIEKSLTLNERIMFTNALFGGQKEVMTEALAVIDSAQNMQEAIEKANRYNQGWDMDSEEIEVFMQVLERRFN